MNSLFVKMMSITQHYNHEKYWKMRRVLTSGRTEGIIQYLYRIWVLYRIKKMDAFNGASFGTHLDKSAEFKSPPNLPHGIRGIFISHNAVIGTNVTIFHQVTIGEGNGGAPVIGDNVLIGAGAKILGGIKVGNNVRIGANCVVVDSVPDGATVVCQKARVIDNNFNGLGENEHDGSEELSTKSIDNHSSL